MSLPTFFCLRPMHKSATSGCRTFHRWCAFVVDVAAASDGSLQVINNTDFCCSAASDSYFGIRSAKAKESNLAAACNGCKQALSDSVFKINSARAVNSKLHTVACEITFDNHISGTVASGAVQRRHGNKYLKVVIAKAGDILITNLQCVVANGCFKMGQQVTVTLYLYRKAGTLHNVNIGRTGSGNPGEAGNSAVFGYNGPAANKFFFGAGCQQNESGKNGGKYSFHTMIGWLMVAQTYWRYRSRFANEILGMYEMKNFTDERLKTVYIGNSKIRMTMLSCHKRKSQQ